MRALSPSWLFSGFLLLSVLRACHAVATKRAYPKVASAWFAGWHATAEPAFPISKVSWSKYTHMTYSFAETTPDVRELSLADSDPDLLPKFVAAAHRHGVKASVSIGGWTGSRWWSSNVGSAHNRTLFVHTVVSFAKKYHLDGLDFDWEYPGHQGIGCNVINPADSANFLAFIRKLREDPVGAKLILTAATAIVPFYGANGSPSTNVAGFARVLDWITIMNYDIWGSWSPKVGPNAPLDDSCAPSADQVGSAASTVDKWHSAGMPLHQIVLGVAAYGHSYRVERAQAYEGRSLALYPPFERGNQPAGDHWDGKPGVDACGNPTGIGGIVNFWGLVWMGYLKHDGTPHKEIAHMFDNCSKTAYVYNATSQVMVSYDNAKAFSMKGGFIKSRDIRGFSMWEAGGDFNDILLDAIRKPIGF
ncbi:hypothetical protein APHAL10511_001668 [Amanita phalloides]|nr:hypothetical protein APHAL10511_001668 [Amanita phalloides]